MISDEDLKSLFEPSSSVEDISLDDQQPKYPGEREDLSCGECGSPMRLIESKKYRTPFYGCKRYPECSGKHGALRDGSPKGIPGNKATRQARIYAHMVFDQIWKTNLVKHRGAAYTWLRKSMGLSQSAAHIAMFTKEQCEALIEHVYREFPILRDRYTRLMLDDPFE